MRSRSRRATLVIGVIVLSLIAVAVWWSLHARWWSAEGVVRTNEASLPSEEPTHAAHGRDRIAVGGGAGSSSLVLGELLRQTLIQEGYLIVDLVGMESSERTRQALADADIDLAWCSAVAEPPVSADVVALPTLVFAGWRVIVSEQLASQLARPTLSALSTACESVQPEIRSAAAVPFSTHSLDRLPLQQGVPPCIDEDTTALPLAEVETRLKLTWIDLAVVPRLEETLTVAGFVALEDDLGILSQQPVSMLVRRSLFDRYPELEPVLRALGEQTTTEIIRHLVTQVRLLQRPVEDVVREYLATFAPGG